MTLLPSHWLPYLLPEKATAQTVPSVSTNVPHMLNPSPPFTVGPKATTFWSWSRRLCQLGNVEQSANAGPANIETTAQTETDIRHLRAVIVPPPLVYE